MRILYLSYTGLLEPLGHSQLWGYLRELSGDHEFSLITFEKPRDLRDRERREMMRRLVEGAGIDWHPLRYHRTPTFPATTWDLLQGAATAGWILRRADTDFDLVHARGHVAGALALLLWRTTGISFVFDLRGFWAEAKVDAGHWTAGGVLHRTVNSLERRMIDCAAGLVVLTDNAREVLEMSPRTGDLPPTETVPTCVDLELFVPEDEREPADEECFTLGYVGSASGRYRFSEVLDCYEYLLDKRPDAWLHILNRGDHEEIRCELERRGLEQVKVEERPHQDVAQAMKQMDAGVFFYPESKASKATSPTKMGEFLACGLPCLTNAGVGDAAPILRAQDTGVVLEAFHEEAKREAVDRLLELATDPNTTKRCRGTAVEEFSLDRGVKAYDRLYQEVVDRA